MIKGYVYIATLNLFFLSILSYSCFAEYGKKLCKSDGFHCLYVKKNYSWKYLFPNEHDRGIVMRVNRMNTHLYGGLVIAVPNNLAEADIMDFSPFSHSIESKGEKVIVVNTKELAWGAYDSDGSLVQWGPASTGAEFCHDIKKPCPTHSGTFRIYSAGDSSCYSKKFPLPDGGAPMPYCMYFNGGQALHGEPKGLPGRNVSHGCVRLYVNDAKWLRYSFIETDTKRGTKVIVIAD